MTEEGADILKELADYVRKLQDLNSLEQFLCERLDIGRVVIIPGDSDQEEVVKREIGRAAARILGNLLNDGKEKKPSFSSPYSMSLFYKVHFLNQKAHCVKSLAKNKMI